MSANKTDLHLPDFLIIGAGKSGTTSLEAYLNQHPGIFLPTTKEPNFFAYEKHSVTDFHDEETILHFNTSVTDFESYCNLFSDAQPNEIVGEISNTYMYMPHALESILNHVPNTKIIAILRQPAERIFSRYMHLVRVNKQPEGKFEDLFDKSTIWWDRADLIKEGFYFKNLEKFFKAFDKRKIKILLQEDLLKKRDETLREVCQFLEVDKNFDFKSSTSYNQSGFIKNKFANKLIGNDSIIIHFLRSVAPKLYSSIRNSGALKNAVEKLRNKNIEKQKLSAEMKGRITNEIYKDDLIKLEKLIERDLSHWFV